MKLLLVIALAIVQAITTTCLGEEHSLAGLQDNRSLLSSLLKVAGYSDICVAAALDTCNTQDSSTGSSTTPHPHTHYEALVQEARQVLEQVSVAVNKWESQPRHCKDLLDSGDSGSGLRQVYPYPGRPHHRVSVFCDHTVDGGGWTVFQRRTNDTQRQDFNRTWIEYQLGFGDLEGEFWLGLDLLHQLTSTSLQQLRVDLDDYEGVHVWAKYGLFHVAAPEDKFRLKVGRYSGNAGDSLTYSNNQRFSTPDADHDSATTNCAADKWSSFWYNACSRASLNGFKYEGNYTGGKEDGTYWYHFKDTWRYSLKRTIMMIRPAF